MLKPLILNLVHTTRFWNNLHKVKFLNYWKVKELELVFGGNTNNNPPLFSLMVNGNKGSPTYIMVNDNKVSPTYNDYVVYALPTLYKVMPHRSVFVGEWEHKYSF
jgi:hypothetical protein